MKNWQFNILFFVGVGGAVLLVLGPAFGLHIDTNPTALSGIGAILTYILTQKGLLVKKSREKKAKDEDPEHDSEKDRSKEG